MSNTNSTNTTNNIEVPNYELSTKRLLDVVKDLPTNRLSKEDLVEWLNEEDY